ncbi:MAG: T9SS type A sorting domain-containing protein [Bacteroidia bacterium]|nr:T9SS type A sorting domain-containing protein [Bacteroidia bacterium]
MTPWTLEKYLVSFWVSLSDNSNYITGSLGAHLSSIPISGVNCAILPFVPQILNPQSNILNSKSNWQCVVDTFYASGAELYLTIGNFNPDSTSDTAYVGGGFIDGAHYYIDDVSVIDIGWVGIEETGDSPHIHIFPNPSTGTITVDGEPANKGKRYLEIYDVLGNKILTTVLVNKETQINLLQSGLRSRIYFYNIKSEGNVAKSGKLILSTE